MVTISRDGLNAASPRLTYRAASAAFIIHGITLGAWAPRIPDIRHALGLGVGGLGAVLLGAPVGTVLGQVLGAGCCRRWGSRATGRVALVVGCVLPVAVAASNDPVELFLALCGWGAALGVLDLAMNASAVHIEDVLDRRIMVGLHARWSVGALIGSGIGAGAAAIGVSVLRQQWALAVVLVPVGLWLTGPLLDQRDRGGGRSRLLIWPRGVLALLAVLAGADFICEGSVGDWSAVYLRQTCHAAAGVAGAGYSAYLVAMIIGRLAGDRLSTRFGPTRVVRVSAAAATVAMVAALASGSEVLAFVGFAALGLGLASTVPLAFAAAARSPGNTPNSSLAVVTTVGYTAYMAGPPVIGGLASLVTLPAALGVVPGLTVVMIVVAGALRSGRPAL